MLLALPMVLEPARWRWYRLDGGGKIDEDLPLGEDDDESEEEELPEDDAEDDACSSLTGVPFLLA